MLVWLLNLTTYLLNQETESPINLIGASVAVAGWMTLILVSKHSENFVYLTPILRLLVSVFFIWNINNQDKFSD